MTFWWAIVLLAIFLIGVTKSGFGAGVGLMIVPMTAISLGHIPGHGSEAALGLLLPLLISGDLVAVWQYYRLIFPAPTPMLEVPQSVAAAVAPVTIPLSAGAQVQDELCPFRADDAPQPDPAARTRAVLWMLMPGTLVGIVLGGFILALLHRRANLVGDLIRIEIGVESILLVALHWWRLYRGVQQHLLAEPWRSHLTGGFAAVSSTLAHAAGPIVTMYLLPLRLDRQFYVGACAFYFFIVNTAKLPAYWATRQFDHAQLSFTFRFIPLVLAGAIFGKWVNKHLSDVLFTRIVYLITFALGWYILADGLLGLFFNIHIA